ncbi:MAG TPA: type II secretion system protein [Candidatus Dormibacteraeota bacterium]|nr:type II secretion system protein [Candidatus Dormibacteraeota bacterium]
MRTARRTSQNGVTLVELVVTIAVMSILAGALIPITKFTVKRQKELELRRDLRTMRQAIDLYKKFCDTGVIQKSGVDSECYPPDLDTLVEGVEKTGALGQKIKFLRRIPLDPMIKSKDWGLRSYQDEPDSTSWGHENVYDVYTTATGKALDGTSYKDW